MPIGSKSVKSYFTLFHSDSFQMLWWAEACQFHYQNEIAHLISLMALSWTLPIKQKHARYPQIVTLRVAAFDKNITFSCVNTIKLLIPMWNVRRPPITIKSVLLMLIKSSMIWKEFFWCSGGVEEFERVNTTCSSAR